jgi:hypothetical protein
MAYDIIRTVADAIKRAGKDEGTAVKDALEKNEEPQADALYLDDGSQNAQSVGKAACCAAVSQWKNSLLGDLGRIRR